MTNLMRMSALFAAVLFSTHALAGEAPRRPTAQPARPAAPQAQSQVPTGLTPETAAKQAFIIDAKTGTVLLEKNSDDRMAPSSMSKMMTSYLVFRALKEGRLQLDSKLPVSQRAWRMQGSKMFVMVGTQVTVEDLVRGMVIQSGNDACIVLAEGLAGSEDAFSEQMTVEGRKIGLKDSVFKNASGWPDPEEWVTARDLAVLAQRLIADFPEYYHYFSEMEFTYGTDDKGRPIKQGNRNPLLYKNLAPTA